jgi:hypothetical protein
LHKSVRWTLEETRMQRLAWLVAIVVAVIGALAVVACRRGVPVLDAGQKPPTVDGTISGRLTTEGDASRLVARRVEVVNVTTGDRHAVSTSTNGGFTLKVPPGKYRLQVELRPGEAIVKGPDTIEITPSDMDNDIVVVITAAPPKPHPADNIRDTDGLGSPIA